jgi:hypothetical protein
MRCSLRETTRIARTIRTAKYSDVARALSAARAFIEDPARFNLLTVYETRLHRKALADLRQLREIQAERRAAEKETVQPDTKDATATAQPVELESLITENGFVFSGAERAGVARGAAAHPIPDPSPAPPAHAQSA